MIFNVFACNFHLLQEINKLFKVRCVAWSNFWPSSQLFFKVGACYCKITKAFLEDLPASWYAPSGSCTRELFQGYFGFAVQVLVQEMQLLSSCYRCRINYAFKGILPQEEFVFFYAIALKNIRHHMP